MISSWKWTMLLIFEKNYPSPKMFLPSLYKLGAVVTVNRVLKCSYEMNFSFSLLSFHGKRFCLSCESCEQTLMQRNVLPCLVDIE